MLNTYIWEYLEKPDRYDRVKREFNRNGELVILPIHANKTHWICIVFKIVKDLEAVKKITVRYFDSLHGTLQENVPGAMEILQKCFEAFFNAGINWEFDNHAKYCPQQNNSFDCGVHMLQVIRTLASNPSLFDKPEFKWNSSHSFTIRQEIANMLMERKPSIPSDFPASQTTDLNEEIIEEGDIVTYSTKSDSTSSIKAPLVPNSGKSDTRTRPVVVAVPTLAPLPEPEESKLECYPTIVDTPELQNSLAVEAGEVNEAQVERLPGNNNGERYYSTLFFF